MNLHEKLLANHRTGTPGMAKVIFTPEQGGIVLNNEGMTLLEILIAVAFLAILTSLAIPSYSTYKDMARTSRAMSEIRSIEIAITAWYADRGGWPSSLNDVGYGTLKDPWGNSYNYRRSFGTLHYVAGDLGVNTDYDLWSAGQNNDAGTSLAVSETLIVRANDGGFVGLAKNYLAPE